jgi:hypothetical protein
MRRIKVLLNAKLLFCAAREPRQGKHSSHFKGAASALYTSAGAAVQYGVVSKGAGPRSLRDRRRRFTRTPQNFFGHLPHY